MTKNITDVLYIGSFTNIQFINDFPDIKKFIIIDNKLKYTIDINFYNTLINFYKEHGFDLLFIKKIKDQNDDNYIYKIYYLFYYIFNYIFGYTYIEQSLLIFYNNKTLQQINYYISTNILDNLDNNIKKNISKTNSLIVNDEIPDVKLFEYFDKPKILIVYSNIINDFFFNNKRIIIKYFNNIYVYDENNSKLLEYII
jgi:hypothetical protein